MRGSGVDSVIMKCIWVWFSEMGSEARRSGCGSFADTWDTRHG